MDQRARRSTRSTRVVYTEEENIDWSDDKPVKKHITKKTKKKIVDSVDSSSLSGLDDCSPPGSVPKPTTQKHAGSLQNNSLSCSRQILCVQGRAHPLSYHTSHLSSQDSKGNNALDLLHVSLLRWFDLVKEDREMPWRKDVTHIDTWTEQQKGQRAYEVWVSEIMLQQTQVETVKSYYLRWMIRFPTIFDLAKANVEQVNECWQGLGYYSRASRLLSGAKKVVDKFDGVLPQDPSVMEKEVDGIGPYSAGAIASIAYAKPVPMVDGNVHRVLTRITALYAPQTAKATTKFLWSTAAQLVPQNRPGDFNQALMELGATVCKPREANCPSCPLSEWCRAYQEKQVLHAALGNDEKESKRTSELERRARDEEDIEDVCGICQPLQSFGGPTTDYPSDVHHVLLYPMAKERKKPTLREVAVSLVIWKESSSEAPLDHLSQEPLLSAGQMKALLIKRPEKGLLAGLWEFPSIDLPESNNSTINGRQKVLESLLIKTIVGYPDQIVEGERMIQKSSLPDIEHIFSHLRITYKPSVLVFHSPAPPSLHNPSPSDRPAKSGQAIWSPCSNILNANLGNPHKKVWNSWLDSSDPLLHLPSVPKPRKRKASALQSSS
ncbi:hypothetical protein PSTG_06950 [Puccinia striiformis f. sp. tritici PST-78]|uniref:Adenine DNA glycosylase n=1 Tax=Puccinia striiformis f. sp. tritici PST-78 TaxID=1165861 RepID=A0A0L0VKW8_9BASI|nr:hypothetical protein PSTG_06950 [Puccinia striiformis f. sp. tritici PST-78]